MGATSNNKNKKKLTAKAKINLGLDITGRLANGYHGVRMVMQTLAFGDEVTVALESKDGGTSVVAQDLISIAVSCSDRRLPCDERNLAYRAAALLCDEYLLKDKASERAGYRININIDKKIPVAAGLAGGSADAAAVLVALNELCKLGLTQRELMDLGLKLGADVPFCILQGTALSEGIGEVLTPLPALPPVPVLLVKPDISVSTKRAYESWDALTDPDHPDINALEESVRAAAGAVDIPPAVREIVPHLGNTFEKLVFEKNPVVRQIKEDMIRLGAAGALMSGSGPTVFGIFADQDILTTAADQMRSNYPDAFVCETHIL